MVLVFPAFAFSAFFTYNNVADFVAALNIAAATAPTVTAAQLKALHRRLLFWENVARL